MAVRDRAKGVLECAHGTSLVAGRSDSFSNISSDVCTAAARLMTQVHPNSSAVSSSFFLLHVALSVLQSACAVQKMHCTVSWLVAPKSVSTCCWCHRVCG